MYFKCLACRESVCRSVRLCHEAPEKNNTFNPSHPAKLGAQAEARRKTSLWLSARDDLPAILRSALSASCDCITSFFHFHFYFLFFILTSLLGVAIPYIYFKPIALPVTATYTDIVSQITAASGAKDNLRCHPSA